MQQPAAFYSSQIEKYQVESSRLRRKLLYISLLRIASFVIVAWIAYRVIANPSQPGIYALLGFSVLFLLLIRFFGGLRTSRMMAEKMLLINQNEIALAGYGANAFDSKGARTSAAIFAADLDVFGPGSLYHRLNRTTTHHGAEHLSSTLENPLLTRKEITASQHAVNTMAAQPELCQLITARGLTVSAGDANINEVKPWIRSKGVLLHNKGIAIIRILLPLITISTFIYYLDSDNPVYFGASFIATWLVIASHSKYIHSQHALIGKKQAVLDQYASILRQFTLIKPESSEVLKRLHDIANEGNSSVKKLSTLSSMFDQRLNMLVMFLLNSFLMYDLHCMIALERWKEEHAADFDRWVDAVGEIEKLVSLSMFAFAHPHFVVPQVKEGSPHISAKSLAHPLIPPGESVSNDFFAGENDRLLLITGSNMSGKSTFLRTVGINLLLAQCGAPVCATSFEFTPMKILSSIRISDSLQEHTSYFMAELKRLRLIIEELQTNQPTLVLIDEVLRGTNSNDKTYGSEALIRKIIGYNAITIFATHDLSLSVLEEQTGVVRNYCFESTIQNGELTFDYKLHAGVARNRNATFLMQKMGIISE